MLCVKIRTIYNSQHGSWLQTNLPCLTYPLRSMRYDAMLWQSFNTCKHATGFQFGRELHKNQTAHITAWMLSAPTVMQTSPVLKSYGSWARIAWPLKHQMCESNQILPVVTGFLLAYSTGCSTLKSTGCFMWLKVLLLLGMHMGKPGQLCDSPESLHFQQTWKTRSFLKLH